MPQPNRRRIKYKEKEHVTSPVLSWRNTRCAAYQKTRTIDPNIPNMINDTIDALKLGGLENRGENFPGNSSIFAAQSVHSQKPSRWRYPEATPRSLCPPPKAVLRILRESSNAFTEENTEQYYNRKRSKHKPCQPDRDYRIQKYTPLS